MRTRRLLFTLLAGALAGLGIVAARLWPARVAPVAVAATGSFVRGGEYPGEKLALAPAPRTWGSWAGDDANRGTLRLGPFPAPAKLRIAVSGYPARPGNEIFLEMAGLNLRLPLAAVDAGERWRVDEHEIPFGWRGRLVTLVAVDATRDRGGWLAVSEPLPAPGARVLEFGTVADLGAWIANGLLLGLGFSAAAVWLRQRTEIASPWVPLVAGGVVALAGYVAFWAYFAHPLAGRAFSVLALAGALVAWWRVPERISAPGDEWPGVLKLAACVGVFHLALLHVYDVPRDFYDLAANRFGEELPGDNRLPHDLAMRLYHGESPKDLSADWLSSDRPPLQTGWQLLTWPVTAALGFGETAASGTSAVWFQLLWVAAAYGLLRTFGLAPARARAWVALLAGTGFFLQHTVFTWPKLSAAAFAAGALGLWLQPAATGRSRAKFIIGAALAALAWLAHGGVAFSFLALAPWVIWRAARGELRGWLLAAGVFLLLATPWICYQRFYEPPANRLLKWHLGGQEARDPRGTWETIRDGYRGLTWSEIVARKTANFGTQIAGDWGSLVDFSPLTASERRRDEFFHSARAMTWWIAAVPVLAWLAASPGRRVRLAACGRLHALLAGWIGLTAVVWCLLMFNPSHAVIHQGSFAMMLGGFVLFSVWFELASRWWLVAITLLQSFTLVGTYLVSNRVIHGPASGAALLIAAAAGLLGYVLSGHRQATSVASIRPAPSA